MRVHQLRSQDEGAVAILVAILFTLFLVLAAFALDVGNAYQKVRQQSVAADAAALAAAAKIGDAIPRSATTCTGGLLTTIGATAIAQTTADDLNDRNSRSGAEPRTTVQVTCEDGGKAVQVRVDNSHSVPTSLASLIGISHIDSGSYAVARYVRVLPTTGLRPWAICDGTVTAAQARQDTTFATGLDNKIGICTSQSSGNWGSVDFDGGGNSAGTLAEWTLNGYPDPVTIPGPLPADPGVSNSNALRDAFISLVNQLVLFPSVSGYTGGNGNNGTFGAVGVASVRVCGVQYGGKIYNTEADGTASACWTDPSGTSKTTTVSTDLPRIGSVKTTTSGKKVSTLTISTAGFDNKVDGTTVTVTIAGAKKVKVNGKDTFVDLVTSVASYDPTNPTTKVVLDDAADVDVTNKAVRIQWDTTTTTFTPGLVPLDSNHKPIDHIQFRWEDYTSSYTGTGAPTCTLDDPKCLGAVELWR